MTTLQLRILLRYMTLCMIFVCLTYLAYGLDFDSSDDFYNGLNCGNDSFSCGNSSDFIIAENGEINITFKDDLNPNVTYGCVLIRNETLAIEHVSCIVRSPFNFSICDSDSEIGAGNHSEYFNCTSTNLSGCGWNGQNGIPKFGTSSPAYNFQIDTGNLQYKNILFVYASCNKSPISTLTTVPYEVFVSDTKGISCSGSSYKSVVFESGEQKDLGGLVSCRSPSYCDPSTFQNFSMGSQITGNYCAPGCYDFLKNGDETDIDYGGGVCGNCTPNAKGLNDAVYIFARTLQEDEIGQLTFSQPFDTNYCPVGNDVGGSLIFIMLMIVVFSIIAVVVLVIVVITLYLLIGVYLSAVVRNFIKKRIKGKK